LRREGAGFASMRVFAMASESSVMRSSCAHGHVCAQPRTWSSPLRRAGNTFFKLLYRWTHSRAFRHNERLVHGVSIHRDELGRLVNMRIRGHQFAVANALPLVDRAADSESGIPADDCHLIATGPSINEIDYAALRMNRTIGVNGAIALRQRADVRFDYYCIVDSGFVRQRPDLVERVIGEPLTLFVTPLVLWYIAQQFRLDRMRCRVFLVDDLRYPAGKRARTADDLRGLRDSGALALFDTPARLGFSLDIRHGVIDGCTVAYTALQVLASLGFRRIFMHGVDLVDTARTPRFYETADRMLPSHLDSHYDAVIEPSFRHAAALLRDRGVQVTNLSMHSALGDDVFPKLSWRTLANAAARA
jgi:hypothetical protein